jgi:hypothetical protein
VPIEGDSATANDVLRITLNNYPRSMHWTCTLIAHTRDSCSVNDIVTSGDIYDFAAVAGRVIKPDDIWHRAVLMRLVLYWKGLVPVLALADCAIGGID